MEGREEMEVMDAKEAVAHATPIHTYTPYAPYLLYCLYCLYLPLPPFTSFTSLTSLRHGNRSIFAPMALSRSAMRW